MEYNILLSINFIFIFRKLSKKFFYNNWKKHTLKYYLGEIPRVWITGSIYTYPYPILHFCYRFPVRSQFLLEIWQHTLPLLHSVLLFSSKLFITGKSCQILIQLSFNSDQIDCSKHTCIRNCLGMASLRWVSCRLFCWLVTLLFPPSFSPWWK